MSCVSVTMPSPTYRSIFLDEEGAHQKYYGWAVVENLSGLCVLRKRQGIFTRNLLLLSANGLPSLPGAVKRAAGRFGLADLIIHDFDSVLQETPIIGGLRFHHATITERLLNIATFVINLANDEDSLFAAMSADYRRKIRKAASGGTTVVVHERPSNLLIEKFAVAYAEFADKRRIATFDRKVLSKMYEQGNALLLVAYCDDEITNYLHVYTSNVTGQFMFGVNVSKKNDGAGQFIQWQAMRELKARGFSWYDMGGVAILDRSNGVFNFKEKFGGNLTLLGSEWRYIGRTLRPVVAAAAFKRSTQIF